MILQPQGSQSPAQQGPLARPPMPTTPPVRLDITPGGDNRDIARGIVFV